MRENLTPQWQYIANLPLIAHHIAGMLESANAQYELLQPARSRPYVLNDHIVNRVIEVFTAQQNDLWLFDEQLARWQAARLTGAQRRGVEGLVEQMHQLHAVIAAI